MTDPSPDQQIRNLCDRISDLVEASEPGAGAQRLTEWAGAATAPRAPMHHDLLDARTHLKAILVSWARLIIDEADAEFDGRDETTSIAAWIYRHADWLGAHPAVSDFILEVDAAVYELTRIVDRGVTSRKFVGWDNGQPVFTRGENHLAADGTVHTLASGRAALAVTVLDVDLPAKDCAEALKLHGHHVTPRQILKLHEVDERRRAAGKLGPYEGLSPVRVDQNGKRAQPIFRVSEVLARLTGQRAS